MPRNPFLNRSMIRTLDQFYGRRRELQRAMARLGAQPPQSVSLVGERRMGKSSMLWHLSQPEVCATYLEAPQHYLFLSMDCQGQQHLDQGGFLRDFGQRLQLVAGDRLFVPETGDFPAVKRAVEDLDRARLRLVCLFDEFETITHNPSFGPEFFGFLRSLANAHPVAFVTASRRDLESLCHSREISESPFFNIFSQIRLGPMPEAELRELIGAPSAAAGISLEPHAAQLIELGGHLPFFAQIACAAAFDCLAETGELDLDIVERQFMEEAASHFHYLWGSFVPEERRAIEQVLRRAAPHPEQLPVLKSLEADGYLEREGEGYRLFSRAFSRFLQENPAAPEADPPPARLPGPSRPPMRRGPLYLGAALLLAALGFLGYSLYQPAPGPSLVQQTAPHPLPFSLAIEFYCQRKTGEEQGLVGSAALATLGPGDQYRFALSSAEPCYLYAFRTRPSGEFLPLLPDASVALPLGLKPGERYLIPTGQGEWLAAEGGQATIHFIASKERDRELEELYQRFLQAAPTRKAEYRRRLEEILSRQAVSRLEISIKPE
ncbi:MAG: DUF4384 domain-containing protein [Candidatus Latescibacteria bacterium]|nr:DUF4384 domain-containing protein [Candidatus Latescibacterota bacterium]